MAAVEGEHEKEIGVLHLDGAWEVDLVEDGLDVALLVGGGDTFAKRIDVEFPGRLILGNERCNGLLPWNTSGETLGKRRLCALANLQTREHSSSILESFL